ncbi:MAG: hypothetical protein ACTSUN_01740 [Promethearchaeota archaeon]
MEVFEIERELYNAKLRLLNWIFEEISLQPENKKNEIKEKGQELPLNL